MLRGAVSHIRNLVGWEMPCIDATEDMPLNVTARDNKASKQFDPQNCAVAKCINRTEGKSALVYRCFTYTWDAKQIERYTNGRAVQDFEFMSDLDKGKSASLTLHAPSPGRTMSAAKRSASKRKPGKKTRTYKPGDKPIIPRRVIA